MPAGLALLCAVFLCFALPDTPQSVGLPPVKGTATSRPTLESSAESSSPSVFSNPYIWLLAVANFFVYTIRYAMLDWGPTLLTQAAASTDDATWMVAGYECQDWVAR